MPPSMLDGFYDIYTLLGLPTLQTFTDTAPLGLQIEIYASGTLDSVGGGLLKPDEVFNIDSKFDDGKPGYGKIYHFKRSSSVAPNCVTSDLASTASYDLLNKNTVCILVWKL